MKVFILGLSKSGTSILSYRIYDALAAPKKIHFEPSTFGQNAGEDERIHRRICEEEINNCVTKCLIFPQFQPDWELATNCARHYDKKIWIARDPRDRIVSEYFYSFWKGVMPKHEPWQTHWKDNLRTALKMVEQKEKDPKCLPFHEIIVHHSLLKWQDAVYKNLCENVQRLQSDWFLLRYEDLVDGRVEDLNDYLGFDINQVAEVPDNLNRVVRTKQHGDWRNWFTREDQEVFTPVYREYMEKMRYDSTDWRIDESPEMSDGTGSVYIKKISEALTGSIDNQKETGIES